MTTLKPCPHCGDSMESFGGIAADFICSGCWTVFSWTYGEIEEKIEKFNRRSDPWRTKAEAALREAWEALLQCRKVMTNQRCLRPRIGMEYSYKLANAALARIEAMGKGR